MDPSPVLPSLTPGLGLRTAYPRDATLVELFAAHVMRAPEAPAVVFGAESLTYGAAPPGLASRPEYGAAAGRSRARLLGAARGDGRDVRARPVRRAALCAHPAV